LVDVIQPGAKVLDVGCGSGYMTACFALLVGSQGHVYAIDHVKELVETSIKNIQKDNPQLLHRITTKVGDGMLGWPEHAPYDVIYVGAAAESIFHFHSSKHIRTMNELIMFFCCSSLSPSLYI
jgi:protein-L-isoaspartate(D-aspartate) O-methyltransferase